jgi:sec-independent protein translocase protein TatA
MPFGIQPMHLVLILVVALIIFGPKRLPEIGRSIGKGINEFRQGTQEMASGLQEELTKPAASSAPAAPTAVATQPPVDAAAAAFCAKCGAPRTEDALFCNKCGSPTRA